MQLDLLTVICRIMQIENEDNENIKEFIIGKLISCDLPRLKNHLTSETEEWAERVSTD